MKGTMLGRNISRMMMSLLLLIDYLKWFLMYFRIMEKQKIHGRMWMPLLDHYFIIMD